MPQSAMPLGRILLCLHSHMPYVLSHGKSPHGTDWLMESAAECYLPILRVLRRLGQEGIKPHWTINVTPILAEQLADRSFPQEFEAYALSKIDAANEDRRRFASEGPLWMEGLAGFWERLYSRELMEIKHMWGNSILDGLRFFQDQGAIEIVTSCATHGYLPLLGTDESCSAQVKLGLQTYEKHFGREPRGMWLPECAYRPGYEWKSPVGNEKPWQRKGVEALLKENGIDYFFVDSHMIRGGAPLGTYHLQFPQLAELFARSSKMFEPPPEERTEYDSYVLPNGVAVFARDPQTTVKVWSGDFGYPGDPQYLEFHKQLYPGRHRYWRVSEEKQDLGKKSPYDPWTAFERIPGHAEDLVNTIKSTLAAHKGNHNREGTIVAMYDTELFGHWWFEGPEFLYEVARRIHSDPELVPITGSEILDASPPERVITLPEGSWGEGGYHHVWLNDGNIWTWELLYPAEQRMRELACKSLEGEAREVATQAARELLLAEASDWQFLISTQSARDYAEIRFRDHVERFERLAGLAESIASGGKMTPSDREFVDDCLQKDSAFADLDIELWKSAR